MFGPFLFFLLGVLVVISRNDNDVFFFFDVYNQFKQTQETLLLKLKNWFLRIYQETHLIGLKILVRLSVQW